MTEDISEIVRQLRFWGTGGPPLFRDAADSIERLSAGTDERLWCTQCGTVTRDQIINLIGYRFGALVSGNNMPHMSGDPRARIHPSRRRHFDDACSDCADAILAIFKPSAP